MYRMFAMVVLALFVASSAGATETVTTDGVWWNTLTPSEKSVVMFGSLSAYLTGFRQGHNTAVNVANDVVAAMDDLHWSVTQQTRFLTMLNKEAKKRPPFVMPDFSGKPVGAYIDGETYFFSNHPEASKAEFSAVFRCIQNNPIETCDKLAQEVVKAQKP